MLVDFVLNVPPAAKVIWRRDLGINLSDSIYLGLHMEQNLINCGRDGKQTKGVYLPNRLYIFLNSVLRPFQDYFSSYETGQSVGGAKKGEPREIQPGTPAADLGLSHMWPERGSNPHQTQW